LAMKTRTRGYLLGYLGLRPERAFIVEADTEKKAKNRAAKQLGKSWEIVGVIPAEDLLSGGVRYTQAVSPERIAQIPIIPMPGEED